jgi:drug/metabolite transporter (DMT)-like permease
VLLAAVPVLYDLAQGRTPSTVAASGMALGLAALVLITYERGGMGSVKMGILLGVGAGVLFGVAFTMTAETSEAAGLSPVLIQRVAGLLFLIAVQRFDKAPILALRTPARTWAIGSGVAAGAALGSLKLGYMKGSAGPVSVATSQFAAVAVLLSVIFNKERLRTWQTIGVGASGVGVALMALG